MPWSCHSHWRDTKAWADLGLPMSTASDEAAKMFDAIITQFTGTYEDETVGGVEGAMNRMTQADPEFVMGHVINVGTTLMANGTNCRLNPEMRKAVDTMSSLADKTNLNPREQMHVRAVQQLASENMAEATLIWEDILLDYPLDPLALNRAYYGNLFLGNQPQLRDCVARVIPQWKPEVPLYGYLFGLHAFGLCETNFFRDGEKQARKALELNSRDAWSTHSLVHVLEMEGRYNEGIDLMSTTVKDWSSCGMLACHNYWHWAVYNVEKGDYGAAIGLYDSEVAARATKHDSLFQMTDACALLYRLEMQDVDVGDRWHDIYKACRPHIDDHIMAFNDAHIMMAVLGNKQKETAHKMMESLRELVSQSESSMHASSRDVGIPLCGAFLAYGEGDFAKAVDLLMPVRYKVKDLGGSNAQRDVFNQFLISACLKSSNNQHNKMARQLLIERKALKENSPLTDRLMAKAMAQHIHD